jgi:large subunit ribosomal protein L9
VKIVLRQDVDNLGDRGQVVNVAPGYARNFLFPKGLALAATPGNLHQIEMQRKVWALREAHEADDARKLAAHIAGITLKVTKKVGENGALYGSVTSQEIADLLAARGVTIDRRKIQQHEPIKSLGTHAVAIKIHRQVVAEVTVDVVPETAE